jgi:zona occludens toxin
MINFISGKFGAGKTYEAVVNHILPALIHDKRKVITNLPINKDLICSLYPEIDIKNLLELVEVEFHNFGGEIPFSKVEHYLQYENCSNIHNQKPYFFINNAHLSFPTESCNQDLIKFFSTYRHYGFDFMFISNSILDIDSRLSDFIDRVSIATKLIPLWTSQRYTLSTYVQSSKNPVAKITRHLEPQYLPYFLPQTHGDSVVYS